MTDMNSPSPSSLFGEAAEKISSMAGKQKTQNEQSKTERRQVPRHEMAIPALLEFADDQVIPVTITDMSRGGFACDSRQIFPIDTRCWLKLPSMPGRQHFTMMEASVVHCSGDKLGCAFSYMLHPDELDPFIAEYEVAA